MFGSKCSHVLGNGTRCPHNALFYTKLCADHTRNAGIKSGDLAEAGITISSAALPNVLDIVYNPYVLRVKELKHDRRFAHDGKGYPKARVCIAPECCVQPVGIKPHPNDPEDAWLMWLSERCCWGPYKRRDWMGMKLKEYFRDPPQFVTYLMTLSPEAAVRAWFMRFRMPLPASGSLAVCAALDGLHRLRETYDAQTSRARAVAMLDIEGKKYGTRSMAGLVSARHPDVQTTAHSLNLRLHEASLELFDLQTGESISIEMSDGSWLKDFAEVAPFELEDDLQRKLFRRLRACATLSIPIVSASKYENTLIEAATGQRYCDVAVDYQAVIDLQCPRSEEKMGGKELRSVSAASKMFSFQGPPGGGEAHEAKFDTHMQKAHLHTHMKVDADLRASDALRGRKRKCTL